MKNTTIEIIKKYYKSFNEGDRKCFLDLLAENVVHEINHGNQEIGKKLFEQFLEKMDKHYKEKVVDLYVFSSEDGERAAAEFFIEGVYLTTDPQLPPAKGQKYRLRCGAFFTVHNAHITRVTNYYNLKQWLHQIS